MKKRKLKRLLTILVVIMLLATTLIPIMSATTARAEEDDDQEIEIEIDRFEQHFHDSIIVQVKQDEEIMQWAKEQDAEGKRDKRIESTIKGIQLANQKVPEVIAFVKDIQDGGDFDTATLLKNILSTASGIANCIPPYGPIVGVAIELVSTIFFAGMGGEDAPSATALLEDNMNQRFDSISNQISGLENQMSELSNQINDSTNKVISAMDSAFETDNSHDSLKEFYLSSGKDDFGYNQYRNYIYGTTTNNSSATTAYYNLLLHAKFSGAPAEEVKYYYDALYDSLADNRDVFKDYIVGSTTGKSIVQCYYDVLVARPEYAAKTGVSAELAAIQFAYDLYQTQILADEIMLVCNNYQYTQMLLNESSIYVYGNELRDFITQSQIEGYESLDSVYAQVLLREEELSEQFAKDIAYILNTNRTYAMTDGNGNICVVRTEVQNGITYGKVSLNSIVYLDRIPESVCDLFDIAPEDYKYEGDGITNNDGIFKMTSSESQVVLKYKETVINTIYFVDATASTTFSGGSGTVDDPYLISSVEQFKQINHGLDKYYRLIDNIDFNGDSIDSIGKVPLSNGEVEYKEFTGIIDGNGHTISNLVVTGDNYAGIFGKIGQGGVVKNITFNNIQVKTSGYSSAQSSVYSFYAGIIAGDNFGTIENCHLITTDWQQGKINSLNLSSSTTNEGAERSVYFYAGGIAGRNLGTIQYVSISQSNISVSSTHDFGGASTSSNKNIVYAGGICGYNYGSINNVIVDSNTHVTAKAKSVYSPKTTVNPYVTALAGGIAGKNSKEKLEESIKNVYSEAVTSGKASLDCRKSGWGEHYDNRVHGGNAYVPKASETSINKIKADNANQVRSGFPKTNNFVITCEDKTEFYSVGDKSLNLENITIKVDGTAVEYNVLSVYGFDTKKENPNQNITILFAATVKEHMHLLVAEFPITVRDYITGITVSGVESEYNKNDPLPDTVTVTKHYASGLTDPVHDVPFDIENKDDATKECNVEKEFVFAYEGIESIITIYVTCPHSSNYDFSDETLYEYIQTVGATCQHLGYDEYRCLECETTIKTNYKRITTHSLIEEISVDSTCYSEGVIGRIYCEFCNETFSESVVLPMKPHSITEKSETESSYQPTSTSHYCKNGDHWLPHNYSVSERYENDGVVYIYTCKDCKYVSEEKDSNIITNAERKRPVVIVSDGYALEGGDLVTIYVQLINNPGVYAADFGIKYDERLTLVSWSDGMLFEKIFNQTDGTGKFDDSATPESCGYNFVWGIEKARDAKGDLVCPDGNLLKLTFRLPSDATDADKFIVSVVYNQDREAGFTIDTKVCNEQNVSTASPQRFMTNDGVIQLVDHLPGDVNNDNCVDILDILYLANNWVNNNNDWLDSVKSYGDVNLSGGRPNITDAMIILRSLIGGYGDDGNPLYRQYEIALNAVGYDLVFDPILVDIFDEKTNTYDFILSSLESVMQTREGYKFLGWYTRVSCDCKESECVHAVYCVCDEDNCKHTAKLKNITYDPDQKTQTLYAHWERNSVTFKDSDGNDSTLDYFVNGIVKAPSESYEVTFYEPYNKKNNGLGYLNREFDYWLDSDGNKYYENQEIDISIPGIGELILTPVWKEWVLDYPILQVMGYDTTKATWYVDEGTRQLLDTFGYEKFANRDIKELYGKWEPLVYTIVYNLNDDSSGVSHPDDAKYDEVITISNPTRTGYTFTGWTVTGMDKTAHEYFDSNKEEFVESKENRWDNMKETQFVNLHANSGTVTFTANWVANTYSVEYALNGGTFNGANPPTTAKFDTEFTVAHPEREGYTFAGWTITGMDVVDHYYGSNVSNAIELQNIKDTSFKNLRSTNGTVYFVANWTAESYKISYNMGSGVGSGGLLQHPLANISYYGNNSQINYNAQNNTYTYQISSTEDPYVSLGNQVYLQAYKTYYIHMSVNNSYTASIQMFYAINGAHTEAQSIYFGGANDNNTITVNTTGYYVIRLDNNTNGTLEISNFWITEADLTPCIDAYGSTYDKLPEPTSPHYTFEGWYYGDIKVTDTTKLLASDNHTLIAHWNPKKSGYTYLDQSTGIKINDTFSNGKYALISDITLSETWYTIPTFEGILDGQEYKIYGLCIIQDSNGYCGLIGKNKGTIKNIKIYGGQIITSNNVVYSLDVGLICGENKGTLYNITVRDSYIYVANGSTDHDTESYVYAGVLCGSNWGTIEDCISKNNTLAAYSETQYKVAHVFGGGIVGMSLDGDIIDVQSINNTLKVTARANFKHKFLIFGEEKHGSAYAYLGGVVGYYSLTTIRGENKYENNTLYHYVERDCNCNTKIGGSKGDFSGGNN